MPDYLLKNLFHHFLVTNKQLYIRDLWRYFVLSQFRIFLYDHDQIFKTRINLDILDGFDTIQQQEQDIVLG